MKIGFRQIHLKGSLTVVLLCILIFAVLTACTSGAKSSPNTDNDKNNTSDSLTIVVGSYSVAKDALEELLPQFQQKWLEETGQQIVYQQSYEASGTQARAIIGGFDADIALLAMEGDVDTIEGAGLITHDWKNNESLGMVTRSIVVLGVRDGNPLQINSWEDLTKSDVRVLYPNPKTSGGAQWDINAIYGAGLKLSEKQLGHADAAFAKSFLKQIHANVESLDKSGRASMAAFEYGVGDVIVTYENELKARISKGIAYEIVVPEQTILIENPIVIIDKHVDEHNNREAVTALYDYLLSEEAQHVFVKYGFRPVDETVSQELAGQFVTPNELFDIEYLGGWHEVREMLYSKRGIWYQVLADL